MIYFIVVCANYSGGYTNV